MILETPVGHGGVCDFYRAGQGAATRNGHTPLYEVIERFNPAALA